MTDVQFNDFKQFLDSRLFQLEGRLVGEAIDDTLNYVDGNFIRKPSWLRTKT